MTAVVEFTHTFTAGEVEPEDGGGPDDVTPTDAAMQALLLEIEQVVRPVFLPRRVELEADIELPRDGA
ncbi:MAG TPA: hypothetical protein VG817_08765 [Gemmatimonadales bacterium]|nr:hypothetical protein [Gemmatimonadales bacterium]